MIFEGIFDPGAAPIIVILAPGTTGCEFSINGSTFAATNQSPIAMAANYFSLQLTNIETNGPGILIIRFVNSAPEVFVALQIRDLPTQVSQKVGMFIKNQFISQINQKLNENIAATGKIVTKILPALYNLKRGNAV